MPWSSLVLPEPRNLVSAELRDFTTTMAVALGQARAHLVAGKTENRNLLAKFGDLLRQQFTYGLGRIFDERLVEQHNFFVELVQTPFDNFFDHLFGLICVLG